MPFRVTGMKSKPRALIFSGYGLNCEDETKFAFESANADAEIVHINDVIAKPALLKKYQIAAFPGGFSYGDDLGSGRAYGLRLKNHLGNELASFLSRDTLMIGICNGFQILTSSGILPGALLENASARYIDRWVDLKVTGKTPWLREMQNFSLPIAHGEGRYYLPAKEFETLKMDGRVALTYEKGEMCNRFDLPTNPNGALEETAAVLGYDGRVLGMMPHPERAQFFTQLPHWTNIRDEYLRKGKSISVEGPGIQLFKNAVNYFK